MTITPPLSWTGKADELKDIQMYMPLIVSVRPLMERLAFEFDSPGIEYGLIIAEVLKDVLAEDGNLSRSKAESALELTLPKESFDKVKDSLVLHECRLELNDMVAELTPVNCTYRTFPYYYPHGDMFILYVPTDPNTITDPKLRAKLVPYMALRYLDY
jgi:hypothetical protein